MAPDPRALPRLSAPQRRVLEAASERRLRWSRSVGGVGGGYWMRLGGPSSRIESVREATIKVLLRKGLINRPQARMGSWAAQDVDITEQGREALNAAS